VSNYKFSSIFGIVEDKFAIYQSKLPAEIRFIGELLSPAFDIRSFKPETLLKYNPTAILTLLKTHRLYPLFYRLQLPYSQTNSNDWIRFSEVLKQLAYANNMQMLHKASVLAKVVNAFENNKIQVLSLKGPVLSKILHNDFALKASIDLDILISKQQFDHAVVVLKNMGFVQTKFHQELNKQQKHYLLNHFHHIGFFHPAERIQLELHWQVNTNKYFLDYKFEELYNRSVIVEIGGQPIRTPDSLSMVVFSLAHGAHHAWYRLDWLYELSVALQKYQQIRADIEKECKKQGLEKILEFSSQLAGLIYSPDNPLVEKELIRNTFEIDFCINAIEEAKIADVSKAFKRFRYKVYLMRLKSGFRYKSQVFLSLLTNSGDWEVVNLPGRLFFLYYLLRPFIFLINRKKKTATAL
jgi:hypothetical protein